MPRGNPQNLLKLKKGQRHPLAGRRKGTPNKTTVGVKQAVLAAFNKIGGTEALAKWALSPGNRKAFYNIAAKLIPHEIVGPNDGPLQFVNYTSEQLSKLPPGELRTLIAISKKIIPPEGTP